MISVESRRDGGRNNSLGLGFGTSGREMEETELEEGEACDYRDDDDENIDPDVDLSYLDEKVQFVLGHFQKDFEGGVSAENLGAKFGGYGSFLPTYQRSPSVWSQPRSPQKVQSNGTPKSPNNLLMEGDFQNSAVTLGATSSVKLVPASSSTAAPPSISRTSFLESSSKRESSLSASRSTGECNLYSEPLSKPNNKTDQKTLKVRLKLGSDNMAQKTAAIFSDLGFPPSSPEDSPVESGGFSPASRESPDGSPTSILQIMMSSPVPDGLLLTPLPDSLLQLTEKEKLLGDKRPGFDCRDSQGSFSMLADESSSLIRERKVHKAKKMKPVANSHKSMEVKNGIVRDVGNVLNALLNKDIDIEIPEGRELVADSLKLPILSDAKYRIGETAKATGWVSEVSGEIKKFKVKDRVISDFVRGDSESITSQEVNTFEKVKLRTSSVENFGEGLKEKVRTDAQSLSGKNRKNKGNKSYNSCKDDFDDSRGRKELNGGSADPPENKVKLKVTSSEGYVGQLPCGTEQTLSGGKKKPKGSKSISSAAILSLESERVLSSAALKDKNKSIDDSSSKNKLDDCKLRQEVGKSRETHRNNFGDEEVEQADNCMNSFEAPSRHRIYKHEVNEKEIRQSAEKPRDRSSGKEIYQFADKSRDRPNGKKIENPLASGAYQKATQNGAPTANGLVSNTIFAPTEQVRIEDNWVCCDRCQKWRLLPYATNPDELPEKWLCTMFSWLPGTNCEVEEEKTTQAVYAWNEYYFNIPAPNGAIAGVTLPDVQHLDLKQQEHNLFCPSTGGNKKQGSKDTTANGGNKKHLKDTADAVTMYPIHVSNPMNKNQPVSLANRSLHDVKKSPFDSNLANKVGIQHVSKSSDPTVEKHRRKQKERHKSSQDGGVSNHSKTKSKREADPDGSKTSKKKKTEGVFDTEEEWKVDHGGVMRNSGLVSNNCVSAKAAANVTKKHIEYSSSKESRLDAKDNLPSSAKKPKELVPCSVDPGSLDMEKIDNRDIAAKKRKVKEWQESQVYPSETVIDAGPHLEANKISVEGTSDNELKKGKKARVSKSEGRESRKGMGDARQERGDRASQILNSGSRDFVVESMEDGKGCNDKDPQQAQYRGRNMVSQQMMDSVDPLKRDLGYGLPSLAATSSSSKVSGSRKSKANYQEAKGSPVESVSSSPLRISDKTSARRILLGKDDAANVGFSINGSLRRCSDGEGDGGVGHSGSARKEKAHSVVHRGSLESSVRDYQDREANTSVGKAKAPTEPFGPEPGNPRLLNDVADTLDQRIQRGELQDKDQGYDDDLVNKHYGSNGSLSRKPGKGSSSRSKDKYKGSKSDLDKGKVKVTDSSNNQEALHPNKNSRNEMQMESQDLLHYHEESKGGKLTSQEKHGVKVGKDEKSYTCKKDYHGKWSNEGRRENQSKYGENIGTGVKFSGACSKDGKSNSQQNSMQDRGERSSHRYASDRPDHDQVETVVGRGKSQSVPHTGDKQETQSRCPRPVSSNHKGNGSDLLQVDAPSTGGELKAGKQPRKSDIQAGTAHNSLRHSTPGRVVVGDFDGPSPVRRDSSSQVANAALREAKDLKHSADRLKNSGSGLESTGLYFEAVLKFLHGASLLEPCNVDSSRHGESQSVHVYSTTTSLCEYVAQEYERCKEMAFAALAYKCLEVTFMRVVYFRHWSVNKDRHELQAALHVVPPGESPSSSASDVDNLNNQGIVDKVALVKGVGSPHVAGNHVIAARNRSNFVRVLNFTQDVNSAMEASRKSQNAFAAASASLGESQFEGISSVKTALDSNFHDVQGLLRLVRLAMEAISR